MKLRRNNLNRLYRKPINHKRIWKILIVVAVALLAAFLTGYWGNELKRHAQTLPKTDPVTSAQTTEKTVEAVEHTEPTEHALLSLPPTAFADSATYRAALDALPASDGLLLSLYGGDELFWRSASAEAIYGTSGSGSLTARELITAPKEKKLYVAAVFRTSVFLSSLSPAERTARLSYEQLLISELYELGLNEVILDGAPMTADAVSVLSDYCAVLRQNCPGLVLSLTVSRGLGDTDNGKTLLSQFAASFDRLSLDLSAALTADLSANADALERKDEVALTLSSLPSLSTACDAELLNISRFGMQILLRIPDNVTSENCNVLFAALAELSLRSVVVLYE